MNIEEGRREDRKIAEVVERALGSTGQLAKALDAGVEVLEEMERDKPAYLQRSKPYYGVLKIEKWEPVLQAIGRVHMQEEHQAKDAKAQPTAALRAYHEGCSRYTNGVAMTKIEQAELGQESLHEAVAWAQLSSQVPAYQRAQDRHKVDSTRREAKRLLVKATQAGPEAGQIHDVERRGAAHDVYYDAQAAEVPLEERRAGWKVAATVDSEFKAWGLFHLGKRCLGGREDGRPQEQRRGGEPGEVREAGGHQREAAAGGCTVRWGTKGTPSEGHFVDRVAETVGDRLGAHDDVAVFMAGTVLDEQGTTKKHADAAQWADEVGRSLYCAPCLARSIARQAANEGSPEQAQKIPILCELAGTRWRSWWRHAERKPRRSAAPKRRRWGKGG